MAKTKQELDEIAGEVISIAYKHLDTVTDRITTENLFTLCDADLKRFGLELHDFRLIVGPAIGAGKLPGWESRKGRYGGICRVGLRPTVVKLASDRGDDDNNDDTGADTADDAGTNLGASVGTAINITADLRLYAADKRNWSMQKRQGDNWVPAGCYASSLDQALTMVAWRMLDAELKGGQVKALQLKDLAEHIKKLGAEILNKIQVSVAKEIG